MDVMNFYDDRFSIGFTSDHRPGRNKSRTTRSSCYWGGQEAVNGDYSGAPNIRCIRRAEMCSMVSCVQKRTQSLKSLWNDTSGIILPYVTMMLVVIVGLSVLAVDG